MSESKRRPWFSFSLRSLLVVVTLVCIWLAWEMSIVRQRKQELTALRTSYAAEITTAADWPKRQAPGSINATIPPARIFFFRRWLGDEAIQEIWYYPHTGRFTDDEVARLARLFPEAKLVRQEPLMEPCHPGCFPRGTLVLTGAGRREIETMQVGDSLTAMLASGEIVTAKVQSIFVTDNRLWKIRTEAGELITTETQPLCLAADEFRAAGELAPGDEILRLVDGEVRSTKVLEVSRTERIEQVINLVLGDCEAFVAGDGYLARSKPPAAALAR